MPKNRLNEKNIDQLLVHYRNERRRLAFQLDMVKNAITDLKEQRAGLPSVEKSGVPGEAAKPAKRGPGRPRKSEVAAKAPGKPGRPKKRERKVRALNEWDDAVLQVITESGKLMPKEEILEQMLHWAKANKPGMPHEEVEAFLTRTLQKLSGKKKMLGTHHSGLRRGYHYGLSEWFFQSSGKLRKQHYDRLVLTGPVQEEVAA